MECNKDEAIRAKQIAEKKMGDNDFEGARKIALKAQNLYPNLENITQILSICDVQCSAQKSMLGEKAWYEILQVEKLADEATIKKQYRWLALHLHPDKNRFPGAEAAFKLICEANAVLSDPTKKSLYDSKIEADKSASVNPPHDDISRNARFKQCGAQNNFSNGFSTLNQHQAAQSSTFVRQEVFWTHCPFCSVRYLYHRKFVNTTLYCQKCSKAFMSYEISVQDVPAGSKCVPPSAQHVPSKPEASQSAGFQEKRTGQAKFTTGVQNNKGSSASKAGTQQSASRKPVQPEPGVRTDSTAKVDEDLNGKETVSGIKKGGTCNGDAISRETGDLKNKTKKMVVEPSENCDVSSGSKLEDVTIEKNSSGPVTDLNSGSSCAHFQQKFSRKRQHVFDNDGLDDLPSPLKRSEAHKLSEDTGNEQKAAFTGGDSKHDNQNSFPTEASETKEMGTVDNEVKSKGEAGGKSDTGDDSIKIESDPDCGSHSSDDSDNGITQCADPEFNDFDKNRHECCFAVNQFWALYDDLDKMPRFYAKVKKVHTSPFEVTITWLIADPIDDLHAKWLDEDLPTGCGSFELGETEKTSLQLSFSHQVHCEQNKKRGVLTIYPRKGEIWALFKDWDINWSFEPDNHKEFNYEIVEVLEDFDAIAGIKVCYLDKVRGFVSLFQRSSQSETDYFLIGPKQLSKQLYKFSHLVRSFNMRGTEREGVPVDSFELDPASLPSNPDNLYYPGKAKMVSENMDV